MVRVLSMQIVSVSYAMHQVLSKEKVGCLSCRANTNLARVVMLGTSHRYGSRWVYSGATALGR